MKKNGIVTLIVLCFILQAKAQRSTNYDKSTFGVGAGLDFGGFGACFTLYPSQNVGLFGGVGYALAGAGYNLGAKYRFLSDKSFSRIAPYVTAMYGYTTAVVVTNNTQLNKIFYGPSFGFGLDFLSHPGKKGYWSLGLIVPVRGSDVDNYLNDLRSQGVTISNPSSVNLSIGYRFILR